MKCAEQGCTKERPCWRCQLDEFDSAPVIRKALEDFGGEIDPGTPMLCPRCLCVVTLLHHKCPQCAFGLHKRVENPDDPALGETVFWIIGALVGSLVLFVAGHYALRLLIDAIVEAMQ